MLQSVEGIYRNGKIDLLENPTVPEGARVIVTFLLRSDQQPQEPETAEGISFLEAARDIIGSVEGPGDLSTNKAYMEGFGTE
jgi:hypothetical protein